MTSSTFVLLSGALSFGAPIALAIHELVALRRRPGGGAGGERREPVRPVPPKPLPDCLVPKLDPGLRGRRVRELEDA